MGTRLALAALAGLASSCQSALDLGQYRVEGSQAAAESGDALAGGAAGRTPGAEPNGAGGGAGSSGSAAGNASGATGGSPGAGVDARLPDASAPDAAASDDSGAPPGGCRADADCTSAGECFEAVCGSDGRCEQTPRAAGTALSPRDGDCQVIQCDGQGQTETVADNDDVPPDPGTGCVQPACLAGSPIQVPRGRGTACEAGRCDGSGACLECLGDEDCALPAPFCSGGACVECTDASQCPDPRLQCNVAACDANRCGTAPAPLPTGCDDGFFCTVDDSCNVRGFCVGQQRQCPGAAPECSEQLLRCVECTSDDQCQFSCDDQGTCRF